MKFYLIRHGQTAWNAQSRVMGRNDTPLDEIGEKQVHALAHSIQTLPIDTIVSSPQLRAQQTAQVIAMFKKLPVQSDDRLCEVDFHRWQGKSHDEFKDDEIYISRKKDYFNFRHEGVESFSSLMERVTSIVSEYEHKDRHVALVSHADVVRALIVKLLGTAPQTFFQFKIQNASCTVLTKEGQSWAMDLMNFTPTPLTGLNV